MSRCAGGSLRYLPADVASAGDWRRVAEAAARDVGSVDGLVNNAASPAGRGCSRSCRRTCVLSTTSRGRRPAGHPGLVPLMESGASISGRV